MPMKNFTLFGQVLLPAIHRKVFSLFLMVWSVAALAAPGIDSLDKVSTNPQPFAIVFTQQPAPLTICEGSNASFSVVATGSGALSYQWQLSTDLGLTWTSLTNSGVYSGVTTANLQISTVPASMNAYRYRCVVSDGSTSNSNSASLSVNAAPIVQSDNIAVQVCNN